MGSGVVVLVGRGVELGRALGDPRESWVIEGEGVEEALTVGLGVGEGVGE